MYCNTCGKEILDNSNFCNFCGVKIKNTYDIPIFVSIFDNGSAFTIRSQNHEILEALKSYMIKSDSNLEGKIVIERLRNGETYLRASYTSKSIHRRQCNELSQRYLVTHRFERTVLTNGSIDFCKY
jgi:hypothetical protein